MTTLIALFVPVFAAVFNPVGGGELAWTKYTSTTPILLEVNANSFCTVSLTPQESQSVAEVIIDVVDNGHPGKLLSLDNGGSIHVGNLSGGNVRLLTNGLLLCRMALLDAYDEPEKVIDAFMGAATS